MKYLDEILFSYRWHDNNTIKNNSKMGEASLKTLLYEEKILEELELYIGKKIDLDKTLLFFDEVQVSENFIVSLKYFNESEKPYKIVCAGSLLRSKNK